MPIVSGGSGGGTALGNVTVVTGTPTAGQVIVASNGTTAAWGNPGLLLLASQTAGGSLASFDTNTILGGNLPTGFNHLLVKLYGRCDGAGARQDVLFRFNNDSTVTNYFSQKMEGTAAAVSSAEFVGNAAGLRIGSIPGTAATASYIGSNIIDVPQYNATTLFKTAVSKWAFSAGNSTGLDTVGTSGGVWISTAAVTRITAAPAAGNFIAGCWFAVYGIL